MSNSGSNLASNSELSSITIDQILQLNTHLVDPDLSSETRQQYEKQLEVIQLTHGFSISALQICTTLKDVPPHLALAAAVQFRRVVVASWDNINKKKPTAPPPKTFDDVLRNVIIQEDEKTAIRQGIFPALLNVSSAVCSQLLDAFRIIAKHDYPARWSSIFPEIGRVLKYTTDLRALALALRCLQFLVTDFELLRSDTNRAPLNAIVEASFPTLLALATRLCETNSVEAREVQRWVVRLLYMSLNIAVPPYFLNKFENFAAWMDACFKMLALPLPPGEPDAAEERGKWAPWKLRKWIFHAFNRLLSRYGKYSSALPRELEPFCQRFFDAYARRMLQADIMLLGLFRKNQFLPDRLFQALIAFLDTSFCFKTIWALLKDRMLELLVHVVFPLLCFGPKDLHRWREDPSAYMQNTDEMVYELTDPRRTAQTFLVKLIREKRAEMLKPLVGFLAQVLNEFAKTDPSGQTLALAGRCSGALTALCAIAGTLVKEKSLQAGLKQLVRNVVVPAMTCKFPFVRAKALVTFAAYIRLFAQDAVLAVAAEKALQLVGDPELPVKLEAISLVPRFLKHGRCRPVIRRNLTMLIDLTLCLFDSPDYDWLFDCLQAIISKFKNEVQPFAAGLISRLSMHFQRLMDRLDAVEDDDECDKVNYALDETLRAIVALLSGSHRRPDIYSQLEEPLLMIVHRVLTHDCIEFAGYGLNIIGSFARSSAEIPEAIWAFYNPVIEIAGSWGRNLISEIVPVLENFITRDPETVLSPENKYLDNTMRFIEEVLKGPKGDFSGNEFSGGEVATLISVLLQICPQKIDQYFPDLVNMIGARFQSCRIKLPKMQFFDALSSALFYNALMVIATLEKKELTKKVLQLWISTEPLFTTLSGMKFAVIGISAIFRLPLDKAPVALQEALPDLLRVCLRIMSRMDSNTTNQCKTLNKKKQKKKIEEENIDELTLAEIRELQETTGARLHDDTVDDNGNGYDDDEVDDDHDDDHDDDDDVERDDDDEGDEDEDGDDDEEEEEDGDDDDEDGDLDDLDDDDDEDGDLDDEDDRVSRKIIDSTNQVVYFAASWNEFSQRFPAIRQRLFDDALDQDQQITLSNFLKQAQNEKGNE